MHVNTCGTTNYVITSVYSEEGEMWEQSKQGDNVLQENNKKWTWVQLKEEKKSTELISACKKLLKTFVGKEEQGSRRYTLSKANDEGKKMEN